MNKHNLHKKPLPVAPEQLPAHLVPDSICYDYCLCTLHIEDGRIGLTKLCEPVKAILIIIYFNVHYITCYMRCIKNWIEKF